MISQPKTSQPAYLLAGVLFTAIALVAVIALFMLKSKADTTTQEVNPGASAPSVDSMYVSEASHGADIGLPAGAGFTTNEGLPKTIYVGAQLSDLNGCYNLMGATVTLYRSGLVDAENCAPDTNNCYTVSLSPANFDPGCAAGVNTVTFETSFSLPNYVDPSDAGSPYDAENWVAYVHVSDNSELGNTLTETYEVNSLAAFSVPNAINYNTVSLGSYSDPIQLTFSNTGNRDVDSDVYAVDDMVSNQSGFDNILASAVHYSLTSGFTYGTGDTAVAKSPSTDFALALVQQTEDGVLNIPTTDTYWRLHMPSQGVQGTYTNTLVFTAKAAAGVAGPVTYDWVETKPVVIYDQSWYSMAASADGSHLIAGVFGGRLFTSADRGSHWTENRPANYDSNGSWSSVGSNSTGQYLAANNNGYLYISEDYGQTWVERMPKGYSDSSGMIWRLDISSDGSRILAADDGGRVYLSTNFGENWSEKQPVGNIDQAWSAVAMNDSGQYIAVASRGNPSTQTGGRIYYSSDWGSTWSDKNPVVGVDKAWSAISMDSSGQYLIAGVVGGRVYVSADRADSWTERNPIVATNKNWSSVGIDSTGQYLVAAVSNGRLYASSNGGVAWTERQPNGDANQGWMAVSLDSTGQYLMAAVYDSRIYSSTNYGSSWNDATPAYGSAAYWQSVASDSSGENLLAGVSGGGLYHSTNAGISWTEIGSAIGTHDWHAVASDSIGDKLILAVEGGRLYTSINSGTAWTERQPGGDTDLSWSAVASDSSGSSLVAAVSYGRLYTSANSGVSWTERQPGGDADLGWSSVASDSSGSKLVAAVKYGRLYTSANSGVSWTERQPGGDADLGWSSVASDSSGSNLVAVVQNGRVYTSSDSGASWTERQPAGDSNQQWVSVASDASGAHLIVAGMSAFGGQSFTSSDSGASWTQAPYNFDTVASNSTGLKVLGAKYNGRVFVGTGN